MNGNRLKFKEMRENQARQDQDRQKRAAHEMRMRTIQQGQQYSREHIAQKIQELTPEWYRMIAKFLYPAWFDRLWTGFRMICMWVIQWRGFGSIISLLISSGAAACWLLQVNPVLKWGFVSISVFSWIFLAGIQRHITKIIYRGGHVARVGQGPSEWVVRIKISRWFTPVYQCDMDIRSGHVTEVFEPINKEKSKGRGK